jgi:hypothetical protein
MDHDAFGSTSQVSGQFAPPMAVPNGSHANGNKIIPQVRLEYIHRQRQSGSCGPIKIRLVSIRHHGTASRHYTRLRHHWMEVPSVNLVRSIVLVVSGAAAVRTGGAKLACFHFGLVPAASFSGCSGSSF